MALSAPVKALALVVFIAAIAGATYGVSTYVGDTVESQLVTIGAARASVNATPGNNVSYLITVTNRDVASRDLAVEIDGAVQGRSEIATVRGNTTVGVFVPVQIGESLAAGEHLLDVRVVSDGRTVRERDAFLTLRILPDAPSLEPGDSAEVVYVGRLSATGRVFNTNDPALVDVPFAKTDTYRFSQGMLPIQTAPRPNVVTGLYEGLLGMQAGEHRTISFPPEKGYGPAQQEEFEPRNEFILLDLKITNDAQRVPRATFDTYVQESGQGAPSSFDAGDTFVLDQNGNLWPYRIVNITDQIVEYKLAASVGDAYTVYPFWPNSSVVETINDAEIVFRTRPTTAIGEPFTMKAHWPEMSALREVNETAALIQHSPPVGFSYTTVSQLGQPREGTVKAVEETRIVIAYPSANPLAGRDLTFDVIVMSLTKG